MMRESRCFIRGEIGSSGAKQTFGKKYYLKFRVGLHPSGPANCHHLLSRSEGFDGVKLALVCVCTSGPTGKSLHSYWSVRGLDPDVAQACFDEAVRFGADPAKWTLEGLGRLPGGHRYEGNPGPQAAQQARNSLPL